MARSEVVKRCLRNALANAEDNLHRAEIKQASSDVIIAYEQEVAELKETLAEEE